MRTVVGCTALTLALISLVVVLLAIGRLVYPVFGIQLSDDSLGLVVSAAYGALHLALLGFAVAAVTLTWATSARIIGRIVGVVAAVVCLAGSFPWLTPNWWNTVVAAVVGVWGVFLAFSTETTPTAARLLRRRPQPLHRSRAGRAQSQQRGRTRREYLPILVSGGFFDEPAIRELPRFRCSGLDAVDETERRFSVPALGSLSNLEISSVGVCGVVQN